MNTPHQPDSSGKKILVLGGTGAMGVYLVPELVAMGHSVTVVSLDDVPCDDPRVAYRTADAKDDGFLRQILRENFDAVVDFMLYSTRQFDARHKRLLQHTGHYIFLSTYRVYSDGEPIVETTPRLLDVSRDSAFLASEDYALYKARQEDILQRSGHDNWTIVRPAITYSKRRFQLVTLEAPVVVARALQGLPVVVPREALRVQATMSWAGDVARLMARLLFHPVASRECFTLATAEHHPWGEIAEMYREIIGLETVAVDAKDYVDILGGAPGNRYQLTYDRLFNRTVDNAKVLRVTGLKQEDFMSLREGLAHELTSLPKDVSWPDAEAVWRKMDDYLAGHRG